MSLPCRAFVIGSALAAAACGASSPSSPGDPADAPVAGSYLLQVRPGPDCALSPGLLSFPMEAAAAGRVPHPGVQVVLEGDPGSLELEFLREGSTLRGGFGTTGNGVLATEGTRLWIHAIGTARSSARSDGRGEVATGSLMGYLALGGANDEEGALGTCSSLQHAFSLRVR